MQWSANFEPRRLPKLDILCDTMYYASNGIFHGYGGSSDDRSGIAGSVERETRPRASSRCPGAFRALAARTAQYGYSLRQALAGLGMPIEEGTLYPLLRRLESLGLLVSEWRIEDGPPRRYYKLSPDGARHYQNLSASWSELVENGEPPDRQQKVGPEAMHATEVIETYINDTVRLLPRRQRDDVAKELRTLLNEELHAQSDESGRPPDESLALKLVRGYGHPNEAAARYQPPWCHYRPGRLYEFCESGDHRRGRAGLARGDKHAAALAAWDRRQPGQYWHTGLARRLGGGLRRRRTGFVGAGPRRCSGHPATVTGQIASERRYSFQSPRSSSSCTAHQPGCSIKSRAGVSRRRGRPTRRTSSGVRLPCFIGLMFGNLALLALVAIQGRWRRLTRRISIGINMAIACLVLFFAVDGNIFQSSPLTGSRERSSLLSRQSTCRVSASCSTARSAGSIAL